MKTVQVKRVSNRREMDDFVRLPRTIYAGNPCYVPDLEADIRDTFDPRKNAGLDFTDIQPFVAYDGEGRAVGRIAGIINRRANQKWGTRNVRFGFIEFTDDARVSAALLRAVEQWGRERGMTRIEGPMGIFDFDKEGMLVEDFDRMGSMVTIYNPPYYPRHLEALGYTKEVDWVQVSVEVPREVPAKYARVARLSGEMFGLHVRKLTTREVKQGYGRKVFRLLNAAYAPLFGYTELSDRQIDDYLKRYIPLLDWQLLPVIENEQGELVGVAITMPSLSHALRKTGGRLLPWGWLHRQGGTVPHRRAPRLPGTGRQRAVLCRPHPHLQPLRLHPCRNRPAAGGQRQRAVAMETPQPHAGQTEAMLRQEPLPRPLSRGEGGSGRDGKEQIRTI